MTKEEALKKIYQLLLTEPHAPTACEKLEAIAKDALAEPDERNFCPRCGKRTADLTTIHTCTPPKGQA